MNAPARPSAQASHLDAIRGVAALLVVFQHVRQLFFPGLDLTGRPNLGGLFFWITGRGGLAVNVFFVLSGFLIASSIKGSVERARWSWARYADARLTRLLVPLVPALLLTLFWDRLGLHLYGAGTYPYSSPQYLDPNGSLGATTFFGNLFFLQLILVPTFGTNHPLWSLSPEFWYYVMFPMAFLAFRAKGIAPTLRVVLLFAAIALLPFVGSEITIRFAIWLCGAAVAFLPRREWGAGLPFRAATVLGLLAMETSGWLYPVLYNRIQEQGLGIFFAAFVWSLLCGPPKPVSKVYATASEFAAGISYTLYLVHFPLVAFLAAAYFQNAAPWTVTPLTVLATFGISALMVLYAIAIWFPFERNTRRIRERIMPSARAS